MKHHSSRVLLFFFTLLLLVSLACNFGPTPTAAPTAPPQQTPTKEPVINPVEKPTTPPVTKSGAVSSLDDVEKAVIQIEADGTFVDPEVGWRVNVGKMGSGFIIDPSGIAVTNNHVVTGAALIKVWIGGDSKKVYNAKVLGVSECSDLAVIDIDGDGFPYVEWRQGDIKVGTEVYAAGFPLGDPNYTLTNGIVSKAQANGETSWASVDSVVEHTANINPGNSGGPLVDKDGKVIGVNYSKISSTSENFAIGRDEALKVIDQLRAGKNVDSIGVNGGAVFGTVGSTPISGVWVRSVASGSPADKALVLPGDIIYQLEGQVLSTDGSMADYCDILRSHNANSTLSLTIIRFSDLSLLEGQLNGRELAVTGTFGGGGNNNSSNNNNNSSGDYTDYVTVHDDSNTIEVDVPAEWSDVNGSPWTDSGDNIGVAISAAPDLEKFNKTWGEPGLFFGASDQLAQLGGYVQILDATRSDFKDCKLKERADYNDGLYKGKYDYYISCGGAGGSEFVVLSAVPTDNSQAFAILVEIQILADRDWNALKKIVDSFKVIGNF